MTIGDKQILILGLCSLEWSTKGCINIMSKDVIVVLFNMITWV